MHGSTNFKYKSLFICSLIPTSRDVSLLPVRSTKFKEIIIERKLHLLNKLSLIKRTYFSGLPLSPVAYQKAHWVSLFFTDVMQFNLRLQLNWLLGLTHAAYWIVPGFHHTLQFQSVGWITQLHNLCSQAQKSHITHKLTQVLQPASKFFPQRWTKAHKHRSAMDQGIQQ
jgi:hypothetical protein